MNLSIPLSGRRLTLARGLWLLASLVALGLWLAGAYANFSVPLPSCIEAACDPFALSLEDFALIQALEMPSQALLLFWNSGAVLTGLIFFFTAGLIFWRRSDDLFSLIVAFFLVFMGAVAFTELDDAAIRAYPVLSPAFFVVFAIGWTSMVLVFFYFPDGKLVPRKRWMLGLLALFAAFFSLYGSGPARGNSLEYAGPVLFLIVGSGLWSQIYRYRRISGAAQRQQSKWVIFGLLGAGIVMALWVWMSSAHPSQRATPARLAALLWVRPLIIVLISSLPLSLLLSILRYRLWDIDILIRRTLIYGVLTGILIAVYFGGIVLLQSLFTAISGETRSPLVTVITTLGIAAMFNPIRLRVQAFIDRRFYREKFDAERTLAHFAETARDEVDLNELSVALLGAVDETMRPEQVSLWLAERDR